MKVTLIILPFMFFLFFIVGCQTAKQSDKEATENLKAVAEAVTGQEIDEEKLRKVSKDIRENKETQEAISSVTAAVEGTPAQVKYCPLDGKRYSSKLERCPEHDILLKD